MMGTFATLGDVNTASRLSNFVSAADKKRWKFVSNSFTEEPVKSLPNSSVCWIKLVMSTSWIKDILFPLSPSNENRNVACPKTFYCSPEHERTNTFSIFVTGISLYPGMDSKISFRITVFAQPESCIARSIKGLCLSFGFETNKVTKGICGSLKCPFKESFLLNSCRFSTLLMRKLFLVETLF